MTAVKWNKMSMILNVEDKIEKQKNTKEKKEKEKNKKENETVEDY